MRFNLEDAFTQFSFKDTSLAGFEFRGENIQMQLSGVIAVATNPCNEELVDRYVDVLQLRLRNAKMTGIVMEGYRYYDANDVLLEEVPDQIVPVTDYEKIMKECVDAQGYLFQVEKEERPEGTFYLFSIDLEETTYLVTMQFEKAIFEWERFLNRVQQ